MFQNSGDPRRNADREIPRAAGRDRASRGLSHLRQDPQRRAQESQRQVRWGILVKSDQIRAKSNVFITHRSIRHENSIF